MPFAAVLAQVGGLGRFQVLQTLLLSVPILLMASHNLLQNFTAAVPPHRCRLPRATPAAASPEANPAAAAEPSGATLRAPAGTAGAPGDDLWAPGGTLGTPGATLSSSGATFGSPSAALGAPAGTLGSSDSSLKASGATLSSPGATLSSPGATPSSPGATLGSSSATLTSPDATLRPPEGPRSSPAPPGATWVPLDASQGGHNGSLEPLDASQGGHNGSLGPLDASLWGHNGSLEPLDASLGSCWLLVANASGGHGAPEPCREGWDYDRSLYVATIVTEWDLVCGRRQLRQVAQSIYMGGVLVGALLLGGLSDRFGRKALLLWSYLQLGVLGTCTAFAPSYAAYCALRFASGMALSGFGLSIACLVVEWMPTPYRAITVALTGFSYTLGQILLAALAYAVPHWRWLQLTVSLPFFAFFLCSWWLAESARWLVLSGKAKRAVKVLRRVARINGKEEEGEKITVEVLKANMKEELAGLKDSYSISDLVRTAVIRHIFCCLSIIWFSISFSYYGLAMDLQHFGVSIYLIQVIFGAVDFPAKLVVTIALSYVGRRLSLMAALLLAGLVLIANIFVPTELQTLRTVLAVLGKGCLSASFNCVFLYTTELYPTPIRQTGLGFGSTMARVGGMVAPLVKMLDEVYPALPPAVYGVAPLVATVATGFLPETLNTPLPDTIEEVEARAKQKKMKDPKEKIPSSPRRRPPTGRPEGPQARGGRTGPSGHHPTASSGVHLGTSCWGRDGPGSNKAALGGGQHLRVLSVPTQGHLPEVTTKEVAPKGPPGWKPSPPPSSPQPTVVGTREALGKGEGKLEELPTSLPPSSSSCPSPWCPFPDFSLPLCPPLPPGCQRGPLGALPQPLLCATPAKINSGQENLLSQGLEATFGANPSGATQVEPNPKLGTRAGQPPPGGTSNSAHLRTTPCPQEVLSTTPRRAIKEPTPGSGTRGDTTLEATTPRRTSAPGPQPLDGRRVAPPGTAMAFAELLERLGGLGRFQVASTLLLSLPVLLMASHNLLQNFTAATSPHRCQPPRGWQRNASGGGGGGALGPQQLLRLWVPAGERCRRFVSPQWWLLEEQRQGREEEGEEREEGGNLWALPNGSWPQTEPCRDGWSHDPGDFSSTIVSEWDLVCARRGLASLAQSLYMAGVLLGGIVFGGLSDRFGRRRVLAWCYLQMGTMGTCSSFSPSFATYCLFRCLSGMAFSGIVLNSTSLSLEWMPTRSRALVGTFMGYCYTLGQFLLAGIAYSVPSWRWLQLAVSLPFFGFFIYSWWLRESARWLLLVGRPQEALQELQQVARINGREEEGLKLDSEALQSEVQREMSSARSHHSVLDLVRTPALRRISSCLCCVWFSTSFAYYGLAMDLQNFDFNIYVLQLLFGAVDIPAKLLSVLTMTYVGRRFTQAMALLLAGLAILVNTLVPAELKMLRTGLAVLGKGSLAASFNCIYIYTGELYPTVIRQTGMGLANTLSRLGSILAPLVKLGAEAFPLLPFLIYGLAPVASGLVAFILPETRGRALPETIQQVESRTSPGEAEAQQQLPLNPLRPSGSS